MQKFSILFISFFLIIAQSQAKAAIGTIHIADIFGLNVNERPKKDDIDTILKSRSLRNALAEYLFDLADSDLNQKLDLNEFGSIYSHFIYVLSSQPASTLLIQSRFTMGDHTIVDQQLDLLEFAWILTSDLQFISRNCLLGANVAARIAAFLGTVEETTDPSSIERTVENIYSGVFNGAPIPRDDFKELMMYLSNTVGIIFGFNGCSLDGYAIIADANRDGFVTLDELNQFANELIKNLITLFGNYAL